MYPVIRCDPSIPHPVIHTCRELIQRQDLTLLFNKRTEDDIFWGHHHQIPPNCTFLTHIYTHLDWSIHEGRTIFNNVRTFWMNYTTSVRVTESETKPSGWSLRLSQEFNMKYPFTIHLNNRESRFVRRF